MGRDRFGNTHAPGLPYARGDVVPGTEADYGKLRHAWGLMAERLRAEGSGSLFNFTGLERGLPIDPRDLPLADDEIAPATFLDRLVELALEHLGGEASRHDVMVCNRLTAAIFAAHLVLVEPGDTVVGVSAGYSHPAVSRSAARVGARFVDSHGLEDFAAVVDREDRVSLVVLTRLAVTYDLLPAEQVSRIVELAHEKGARVLADDAGGARVGPAVFGHPRTLELGVDVGATGLDKYGTAGPRLGLLGGEKQLVSSIRARAFELGLEARPMLYPAVVSTLERYDPARVRALVACTKEVAAELKRLLGERVRETPVTAQLLGEDILEIALERAGIAQPSVVPYEATSALAMLLLEDYGIVTVHFAGLPPGTSALLLKFVPPETLARFGGAASFAGAVDDALSKLATMIGRPEEIRALLFGAARSPVAA